MPRIGEYRDRVVILTRSLAAADDTGEEVESWAEPDPGTGEHWARLEAPAGGETMDANRQSYRTMTLRFRHVVPLEAVDRVRLKETGDEFGVTGVHKERSESGGWQTVCSLIG